MKISKFENVTRIDQISGQNSVFVITDQHPELKSEINLIGVAKKVKPHVLSQLLAWQKRGVLYIKTDEPAAPKRPQRGRRSN